MQGESLITIVWSIFVISRILFLNIVIIHNNIYLLYANIMSKMQ